MQPAGEERLRRDMKGTIREETLHISELKAKGC